MRTNEIRNEIYGIKKWEEKIKQRDLKYKTKIYTYHFQQYETIRSFDESIYTLKASIVKVEEDQSNLLENLVEFNNKSGPKIKEGKNEKRGTYESAYELDEGRELTANAFESGIFPIKATQGKEPKILTPKQTLQKFTNSSCTSKSR